MLFEECINHVLGNRLCHFRRLRFRIDIDNRRFTTRRNISRFAQFDDSAFKVVDLITHTDSKQKLTRAVYQLADFLMNLAVRLTSVIRRKATFKNLLNSDSTDDFFLYCPAGENTQCSINIFLLSLLHQKGLAGRRGRVQPDGLASDIYAQTRIRIILSGQANQ